MNRRSFLAAGTIAGVTGLTRARAASGGTSKSVSPFLRKPPAPRSRLKLSVSRWPYGKFTLDQLCQMSRELGLDAIDLLEPSEWAVPPRYGLACAMGYATVPHPENRLTDGFNRVENHSWLIPAYQRAIPLAAAAKVPNVICFSGSRKGQSGDEGSQVRARRPETVTPGAEHDGAA